MKHIKFDNKYIMDNRWVRIDYISASTRGYYIMKESVYNDNQKKFDKLLKDCAYTKRFDYQITMMDVVISVHRTLDYERFIIQSKFDKEKTRSYPCAEYLEKYRDELDELSKKLIRLERKIKPWHIH